MLGRGGIPLDKADKYIAYRLRDDPTGLPDETALTWPTAALVIVGCSLAGWTVIGLLVTLLVR